MIVSKRSFACVTYRRGKLEKGGGKDVLTIFWFDGHGCFRVRGDFETEYQSC